MKQLKAGLLGIAVLLTSCSHATRPLAFLPSSQPKFIDDGLPVKPAPAWTRGSNFELKGVTFESKPIDVIKLLGVACDGLKNDLMAEEMGVDFTCATRLTLADVSVSFGVMGIGSTIGSVSVNFAERDFSKLKSSLFEKYGSVKCNTDVVRNRMGMSFEKEICKWNFPDGTMLLSQRTNDLTTGSLTAVKNGFLAERSDRLKTKAKNSTKDL